MLAKLIISEQHLDDLKEKIVQSLDEEVEKIAPALRSVELDYVPLKEDWVYFDVWIGAGRRSVSVAGQIEAISHPLNSRTDKELFIKLYNLFPCNFENPFEPRRKHG